MSHQWHKKLLCISEFMETEGQGIRELSAAEWVSVAHSSPSRTSAALFWPPLAFACMWCTFALLSTHIHIKLKRNLFKIFNGYNYAKLYVLFWRTLEGFSEVLEIKAIAYGCIPTLYRDGWPFLGHFYECVPVVKITKFDKANWLGHKS